MKSLLRAITAISRSGNIVAIIGAIVVWRMMADRKALEHDFVAQTVSAMKDYPQYSDSLKDENDRKDSVIRILISRAAVKDKSASRERRRQDSILTLHPITEAPPACAPWLDALSSCRREADSLRSAGADKDAALAVSDSIHATDSLALDSARTLISSGVKAIRLTQDRCFLGLPCPHPFAEVEYGFTARRFTARGGIEFHRNRVSIGGGATTDRERFIRTRIEF